MTLIFLFSEAALSYFQSVWFWLSECLNQERICDPRLISQTLGFFQGLWLPQEGSCDLSQSNQSRWDGVLALLFERLSKQTLFFEWEWDRWDWSYRRRILCSWGETTSRNRETRRKTKWMTDESVRPGIQPRQKPQLAPVLVIRT